MFALLIVPIITILTFTVSYIKSKKKCDKRNIIQKNKYNKKQKIKNPIILSKAYRKIATPGKLPKVYGEQKCTCRLLNTCGICASAYCLEYNRNQIKRRKSTSYEYNLNKQNIIRKRTRSDPIFL